MPRLLRFGRSSGFDVEAVEATTVSNIGSGHPGVTIHRMPMMPAGDITCVRGIPVTTVARTLIDVGLVADPDVVELALEYALRRGIISMSRLTRRVECAAGRGRKGPSVLWSVLRRRGIDLAPTESVLETRFLQFLRRYKLPAPDRQVRIRHADGLARVDFFYSAARVAVEVESLRHHSGRADWEGDLRRRNLLTVRAIGSSTSPTSASRTTPIAWHGSFGPCSDLWALMGAERPSRHGVRIEA